jgi:hypothetical protein
MHTQREMMKYRAMLLLNEAETVAALIHSDDCEEFRKKLSEVITLLDRRISAVRQLREQPSLFNQK